jgi:hypothetical protein
LHCATNNPAAIPNIADTTIVISGFGPVTFFLKQQIFHDTIAPLRSINAFSISILSTRNCPISSATRLRSASAREGNSRPLH